MRTKLLFAALLLSFGASAQYQWQWAKRGGGTVGDAPDPIFSSVFNSEQVLDIVVDQDNNYYFLTQMTQGNTRFGETAVTVYNPLLQNFTDPDIVLVSTDCSGGVRWTRAIGGGGADYAYKLALDNNGGLYIGANVSNISNLNSDYQPPHFSPTDAMPVLGDDTGQPNPGYKTTALLKYNTLNGELLWRLMPQGDTTQALRDSSIHQVQVSSDGTIHALIGFREGTHLGGQLVVPATADVMKYFIVKFNANGQVLGIVPLAISGSFYLYHTDFRYDENLQRYYLAGFRTSGDVSSYLALSYGGVPFTGQAYMLALGSTGTEIWRKESNIPPDGSDSRIYALEIDADSNLYLAGKYFVNTNNQPVSLGSYQFPVPIIGNIAYVLKMNPAGQVQWLNVPVSYAEGGSQSVWTGNHFSFGLAINGNEIAVATEVSDENWGTVFIDRPVNHGSDAGLLRLNKNTGQAIALHDIMSSPGPESQDAMTAVAADRDGNYITGGYFHKDLFTLPNDNIATLTKVNDQANFTDFFVAKLAASPCGTPAGTDDFGYNNLKVYPNPAKTTITVQASEGLAGYEVVNMLGQVVLKGRLEPSQNSISIETLGAGAYILKVSTVTGKSVSRNIVKE